MDVTTSQASLLISNRYQPYKVYWMVDSIYVPCLGNYWHTRRWSVEAMCDGCSSGSKFFWPNEDATASGSKLPYSNPELGGELSEPVEGGLLCWGGFIKGQEGGVNAVTYRPVVMRMERKGSGLGRGSVAHFTGLVNEGYGVMVSLRDPSLQDRVDGARGEVGLEKQLADHVNPRF